MSDPEEITNWRRLDARITTSGQPREHQLALLADLGIRHVVNLGLHSHELALPDEAGSLAKLGLGYTHIPVAFDNPTEADFARFVATLAAIADQPVHIHCIANMRVSAFVLRWQRDLGADQQARAQALMDSIWQPGGVWARFLGDAASADLPHRGPRIA